MKVLVVAAHPDDEVLGCGGTIARLSDEGHEVTIGVLGEGATSRGAGDAAAQVSALATQARAAAALLGARGVRFGGLPDNRFDTVPLLEVVRLVETWVQELAPALVLTHHAGDLNIDHQVSARAVLTATRPLAGRPVCAVLAFEVPSSTEWSFAALGRPFEPTVFYDVSTTLERKLRAMALYEEEARPFPHPRSPEALRAIAARWGSVVGRSAAEAFGVVREVR
ncbi:MAG: PIG-L family deacetylase [Planctomycetota bacterium]|nr:PIG-L family deacetylase [Planctomycetota bacterium]